MCVQAKNSGFAFECGYYGEFVDIEEAIVMEEEQEENIFEEEETTETYLSKLTRVLSISLPYSFICESTIRLTDENVCYAIIISSLIYGMVITINQFHNRHTKYYWIFALFVCFVIPIHCSLLIFGVPCVIEFYFKKNMLVTFLECKYGELWGHHIYWSLVSWFWFISMNQMFVYLKKKNNYFIIE